MARRKLDFQNFDEVMADLDKLSAGYRQNKNWSLGKVCSHLSIFFEGCMHGFTGPKPGFFMRLIAPLMVWWMIRTRSMPENVKVPDELLPKNEAEDAAEVERLKRVIREFEGFTGKLHESPFAGDLSKETWRAIHFIHCAHHLSFLEAT
jgi:hypothetical protein